ncbi:hypothetical protein JZU69_06130 [bacterium]|nr:hypothetical protein [bacterium]
MSETLVKDMQLTAADFRRWLPGAAGDLSCVETMDGVFVVGEGDRIVSVVLSTLPPRRIALLELPLTRVALAFSAGWSDAARAAFLKRFDDYFRRGGG